MNNFILRTKPNPTIATFVAVALAAILLAADAVKAKTPEAPTTAEAGAVTIGGGAEGAVGEGFMAMFSGDLFYNFRNMDKFSPVSIVPKNAQHVPLPEKKTPLDFSAQFLGKDTDLDAFIEATNTSAFLVIKDGSIIVERYLHGDSADSLHVSFSVAKSFVSAMIGIAVEEGMIKSIDDPIRQYLPQLSSATFDDVSIKHVLQMSSGVSFNENYTDPNSDINLMVNEVEKSSYLEYINGLGRQHEPGSFNHYASINTQLLGLLLQKVSKQSLTQFTQEKLWQPMQMEHSAAWVVDHQGNELAMGGLSASARDFARMGLLYLNQGMAHGKQIVPADWVRDSVTPNEEHLKPGSENSSSPSGYGYQWWVPRNPDGDFLARGIWGQQVYVHPRNNVVIVRLSADPKSFDKNFKLAAIDYLQKLGQSLTD